MNNVSRRTYIATVGASLALPIAAIVTSPLLARALGVDGRGSFSAVIAPANLATLLATAGLPEAFVFFLAARRPLSSKTLLGGLGVSFAFGSVAASVLVLLAPAITARIPQYQALFTLVALTIPFAMLVASTRGVAQGLQLYRRVNVERLLSILVRVIPLVALFLLHELTVEIAVLVTWASGLVPAVIYAPVMRELLRNNRDCGAERVKLGSLLSYSTKVWAGSIAGLLVLRLDQPILAILAPPSALGLYVIAVAVAEVPQSAVGAIQQITAGRIASGHGVDAGMRTLRLSLAISLLAAMIGGILCQLVVPFVFGVDFAEAIVPTQVLLFATVPGAAMSVLVSICLGVNRPGFVILSQVLSLCLAVGSLAWLVPLAGATGAAWSSLVTYAAAALLLGVFVRRAYPFPLRDYLILRADDFRVILRRRSEL